jgi:predicted DNA-binding protein
MQATLPSAPPRKRPPGRPRTGKLYATASIRLEAHLWVRIDKMATVLRESRNAMVRIAVEQGLAAMERAP